jgi:hypothetical protein
MFFDLVKEVWESENMGWSPMERWQNKIRRVRRFLRGWAKNLVSKQEQKNRSFSQDRCLRPKGRDMFIVTTRE